MVKQQIQYPSYAQALLFAKRLPKVNRISFWIMHPGKSSYLRHRIPFIALFYGNTFFLKLIAESFEIRHANIKHPFFIRRKMIRGVGKWFEDGRPGFLLP